MVASHRVRKCAADDIPAFLLILRPKFSVEVAALWFTVLLVSVPSLTVYANGYTQFGVRYYIQVFPFVLVLMAFEPLDQFAKILIVASVLLTTYGAMVVRVWGFA